MKFSVDDYIDEKIDRMIKGFKDKFVKAQMTQDFRVSSGISKKILKAEEAKINYRNHYPGRMEDKSLKKVIDKDEAFDLTLFIQN